MITGWHRPTRVVVHTKRITDNVRWQLSQLPQGTEIFAVVKANGYGHGAVAVAQAAKAGGATGFCVALLDEALQLRSAGFTEPILILNMVDAHYLPLAIENNFMVTCGNLPWLKEVRDQLAANPKAGTLHLQLKIDSGMGRIGFAEEKNLLEAYNLITQDSQLDLQGVFTHFATADEEDATYYQEQLAKFEKLVAVLPERPRYVHSSNSATALWHHAGVGNVVRLGVSMYGLNPSGTALALDAPLKPALELVSELIQVKLVPSGQGISYGKTYTTPATEWIGTVPIGYADGWLRKMQGFHVLVAGVPCEIIGRVCMDQMMIRLPQEFPIGTKVTLIGENNGQRISVQAVAQHLGTIHYEVCCQLSDRIPRVYQEK